MIDFVLFCFLFFLQIVGDGSKLSFGYPERISHMEICLYINTDYNDDLVKYPTRDFGFTTTDYEIIYPLNFAGELNVEYFSGNLEFWCVNVSRVDVPSEDATLRIFPIIRMTNFENADKTSYSHSTISLVYTLAACYILDLFFLVLFVLSKLRI